MVVVRGAIAEGPQLRFSSEIFRPLQSSPNMLSSMWIPQLPIFPTSTRNAFFLNSPGFCHSGYLGVGMGVGVGRLGFLDAN